MTPDAISGIFHRRHSASARFEELVREHRSAIYRFGFRMTGSRDEAEDLIQDSLIEAYEAFGKFQAGTHFDRWMFRIMRNTYIDRVRRRPKTPIDSLDARLASGTGAEIVREIADLSGPADASLMARTLDGPIQEALESLPEEFRTAVILADIEGLSYEEISGTIGCPVGTVRSRLHRGRAILKERLKTYVRF